MNQSCIKAIIKKDAVQAVRNRLVLLALIGGVLFAAVYYILPSTVEETFTLAVTGPDQLMAEMINSQEEGIHVDILK